MTVFVKAFDPAAVYVTLVPSGCAKCGTPIVSMYCTHLLAAEAMDSMPPSDDAVGAGRSAPTIVRRPTDPDVPLGVARNWFWVWPPATPRLKVPPPVIEGPVMPTGLPETVSHVGVGVR